MFSGIVNIGLALSALGLLIGTATASSEDGSVRDYEPELALYGGEDGMDFYRIISRRGITTMRPGGCVLVECGWKQAREVATLFYSGGLEHIETIPDLNGIDRVVRAYVPKDLEGLKE